MIPGPSSDQRPSVCLPHVVDRQFPGSRESARVYWLAKTPMSANRTVVLVHPRATRHWSAQPWCDLPLELIGVESGSERMEIVAAKSLGLYGYEG